MSRRIATGIDIGSHHTKVVVVEEVVTPEGSSIQIIGTGLSPSYGMRQGYVVDVDDVAESVRTARAQAESAARIPIRKGFLAIGGISLDEVRATGSTVISRADQEITELDIEKTREAARTAAEPQFLNRKVLHEIPLEFRVDGVKSLGEPHGMKGTRLEADYLFISCLTSHEGSLHTATESADIEVIDVMASPLAGSYVTLTKDQKMKGCVLANIGAETVSIVVYDEGVPLSVKVFPLGSSNVTDDLALAFKISLEDAEKLKLGRLSGTMYPRKKVDEVVSSRFKIMFEQIDKHLKVIGRKGTLPAGILISGGASSASVITDIAKNALALPSRIAEMKVSPESKIRDSMWSVAYGIALWGLTGDMDAPKRSKFSGFDGITEVFQNFLKQFLP